MTRGSLRPCLGTTVPSRRRVRFRQALLVDDPHVREAAEPSLQVEPVADEEVIGHGEADVAERDVVDEPPVGPVQQGAGRDLTRPAQGERLDQVVESQACVDHVLDDEDVTPRDREVEILDQANLGLAAEGAVIPCEDDEVERVGDLDRAREVGQEDERALENGDEDGLSAGVIVRDLRSQLVDPCLDLVTGEIDLSDPRVERLYEARFSLYLWARRSKSRRVKSLILISGYFSRSFRIFRFLRVTRDCFITVTSR
jgi:hypothetical protein